ncbi:hypothetical protein [Methanobacterium formicicum]|uniref:Uncharacterized protein n=1 Tax=Methanobacterium formicicum (strain DSM 3637 / PP1) TaxID=1204725 RepID=K2R8T6_METFP|nr:hypothetical protein [Methanobacterium formicicum]EKF84724.1 hypothetical protein A994_11961 [Methanobacterium formicicum DSM 3637]
MNGYKIMDQEENQTFVVTQSYQNLLSTFHKLPDHGGIIVHVVGAPGTGKSTNIYAAVNELGLNFYEAKLPIPSLDLNSRDVFNLMVKSMKQDLGVKSNESLFDVLKKFDAVLFADLFHDYHVVNEDCAGFSQWTDYAGFKSLNFYLICIYEYLRHRNDFKDVNMVFQTAWRIYRGGKKKDLFTDMGPLSRLAVSILEFPFEVVEISYSEEETINIVKSHLSDTSSDEIKQYMKKYGNKPRFICQDIKTGLQNE